MGLEEKRKEKEIKRGGGDVGVKLQEDENKREKEESISFERGRYLTS
jgi:hypothetical protein